MEIERKYLLKELPELETYENHKIEQAYLCTGPVVRVRREDETYYMTYKGGGLMAREEYREATKFSSVTQDDLFIMDIIRQEVKNDDPRIQRNISR